MSLLHKLMPILEADYNPDYWSDNVKTEAGSMIDRLSENEWDALTESWQNQTPTWRRNFAEASFLSDKPRVISLLVCMLRSPEAEVGAAIAKTLVEKQYFWEPDVDLVGDLKRHLESASELDAIDLQALLNRLPH